MTPQVMSLGRLPERNFVTQVGVSFAYMAAAEGDTTEATLVIRKVTEAGSSAVSNAFPKLLAVATTSVVALQD